jgi:tetratricopeptide (TPR) repeat protein
MALQRRLGAKTLGLSHPVGILAQRMRCVPAGNTNTLVGGAIMKKRFLVLPVLLCASSVFAWSGAGVPPENGKIPITTSSTEAKQEFLKGRQLADNLQLTNSLNHFDKAVVLDPDFASAYLARAAASGTAKEFFDYLHKAVAHADAASEGERMMILAAEAATSGNAVKQKECLEKAVQEYPADERAHLALGNYYFGQQRYRDAIDQYKRSIDLAPDYAGAYNILGYAYRQVEDYPEAEKVFKRYTELIPNDPNPHDSYAELLMKMGKFDESIANYRKSLAIDPHFVASYAGLAMNYLQKGMPMEAEKALDQLGAKARNDGERRTAIFGRVVLYADAGKFDQALKELDRQFALSEKDRDAAQMATDYTFRGNVLVEMGKYDEARKAYEKSLQVMENSNLSAKVKENARLFHHYSLVPVEIGKGDLNSASAEAETFRKGAASNNNPNQIRLAHELAGLIALAGKDYAKAISEFKESNLQNPYNLYRLGLSFEGSGEKAEAKEYFGKAAHFNGLPGLNYAFIRTKALKMAMGT